MRRGVSLIAVLAVLVQGPAVASKSVQGSQNGQVGRTGLCRQPDALPQLAAERWNQQQPPRPVPMAAPTSRSDEGLSAIDDAAPSAPPPPPPSATGKAESADMVVTGSESRRASMDAASPISVAGSEDGGASSIRPMPEPPRPDLSVPPPRPRYVPQAGILTAGEHDDLLNPELYALYQRRSNLGQEVQGLPALDTARVLTVTVKDGKGRPVPFAPVEVACSDGGSLRLATTADGTVSLFPGLDRLGKKVRVRAAGAAWREVSIARDAGGQRVDFTTRSDAGRANKLDLMLVIDTTGSMGDEIRYLQAELGSILTGLRARHHGVDIRVGFVFYRDLGDDYVTQTVPLTRDFAAAQGALAQQGANGGGDYPEAMEQALIRAAGQDWRDDAVKTMLLVADAPPHDDKFGLAWQASEVLRHRRVQIVPVAASGVADKAEYAMRAMAALTQSRYTFLTDDSGVGNAHAAPAIDCYLVTRLGALLARVIDSQLSGRRIEPGEQEVIRTVGQYDHGKCLIPSGGLLQQ